MAITMEDAEVSICLAAITDTEKEIGLCKPYYVIDAGRTPILGDKESIKLTTAWRKLNEKKACEEPPEPEPKESPEPTPTETETPSEEAPAEEPPAEEPPAVPSGESTGTPEAEATPTPSPTP